MEDWSDLVWSFLWSYDDNFISHFKEARISLLMYFSPLLFACDKRFILYSLGVYHSVKVRNESEPFNLLSLSHPHSLIFKNIWIWILTLHLRFISGKFWLTSECISSHWSSGPTLVKSKNVLKFLPVLRKSKHVWRVELEVHRITVDIFSPPVCGPLRLIYISKKYLFGTSQLSRSQYNWSPVGKSSSELDIW